MVHPKFGGANFLDKSRFKNKNCWKIHYLPKWIQKFHKQDKVSNTDQNLSWKLVS